MAEYGTRFQSTKVASVDLNANLYTFVLLASVGAAGKLTTVVNTGTSPVFGVLQNKPKAGEHGAVTYFGSTKVRLANSLGPNTLIMSAVSGFAVAAASGTAALGQLVTGATSGAVGEMHFFNYSLTGSQ